MAPCTAHMHQTWGCAWRCAHARTCVARRCLALLWWHNHNNVLGREVCALHALFEGAKTRGRCGARAQRAAAQRMDG